MSLYIWIIFCVLPFYFIFRSTALYEIIFGIAVTLIFFITYWISYTSRGRLVYIGLSIEFVINIAMTLLFGYVYFALFSAFFIGNIKRKAGFVTFYVIHLVTTVAAMALAFWLNYDLIIRQIPFLVMTILGVILIPINRYSRLKQEELEGKLEDANRKIARLAIVEERHRIARDLHDTLGQKLSLIGLKSELSRKLMKKDLLAAEKEMQDIQHVARQALKEVREMVSEMRMIKLTDELDHVQQLLTVAGIQNHAEMKVNIDHIPLLIENVLSMCLREAVTNVVKHSEASHCTISIIEKQDSFQLEVTDNGVGTNQTIAFGNGLKGMRERLEFVEGKIKLLKKETDFTIQLTVPKVIKQMEVDEV